MNTVALFVVSCLCAFSNCLPLPQTKPTILHYNTDTHARHEEGQPGVSVRGSYKWSSGDKVYKVDYTADENGYKPVMTVESVAEPEPILEPITQVVSSDTLQAKPATQSEMIAQLAGKPMPVVQQDSKPEPQPELDPFTFNMGGGIEAVIQDDAIVVNIPVAAPPPIANEPVTVITPEDAPRPDEIYTDDAVIIESLLPAADAEAIVQAAQVQDSLIENDAVETGEIDQGEASAFVNSLVQRLMDELYLQAYQKQLERQQYRQQFDEAGLVGEPEENPEYETGQLSPIEEDSPIFASDYERLAALQYNNDEGQIEGLTVKDAKKQKDGEDIAYVHQLQQYLQHLAYAKEVERLKQGNIQSDYMYELQGEEPAVDESEYWRALMEYYVEEKYKQEMIAQTKHNSKFDSGKWNQDAWYERQQQPVIPQDSFLQTSCRRILALVQQQLQQQFLNSLVPSSPSNVIPA